MLDSLLPKVKKRNISTWPFVPVMPCLKSESKTKKVKISLPWERMIWTQGILSKEILYLWPLPRPGGILMPGLFWILDPRYHAWYGGYFCNAPSWRYSQYAPPSNNTSQLTYCPKWFAEQTFIKEKRQNSQPGHGGTVED